MLDPREDLMGWGGQIDTKLRSIGSKPEIARLMIELGMNRDPLAETNSLYEHFRFLLKSGVGSKIAFRVLSKPKWFKRSFELRNEGASQEVIFWTLTDQGRLVLRGSSRVFGGVVPWILNKIVDLFKESILSKKTWSTVVALLLAPLCVTSVIKMWHGERVLISSLLVIISFFGACGFAYNLYPSDLFDENAQQSFASTFLLFFALWLLAVLGYGFLGAIRMIAYRH